MALLMDAIVCRPVPRSSEEGGPERPSKEGEHYSIIRKIGEGSFGVIYLGKVWELDAVGHLTSP